MRLFKKEIDKDKLLYGGLIATFAVLYIATAFVSWYHAITFFNIANAVWLSVILSFVAEIGQASALFSILLTKNSSKFLTWSVMVILTTLQVIGNVVSSYDWIIKHGGAGVESFQKSILFWMNTADPDIFKVVIAWISGALLPIIALSMTALVAQNIELQTKGETTVLDGEKEAPTPVDPKDFISEVVKIHPTEDQLKELESFLNTKKPIEKVPPEEAEIKPNDELKKEEDGLQSKKQKDYEKTVDFIIPEEEKKTSDVSKFHFISPGVPTVEREVHEKPSIEQILADLSPEAKQYMKEKLEEEVPPIEQLTNEEIDSYEQESNDLDDEVASLTPELATTVEISQEPKEVVITSKNGLIEAVTEEPAPSNPEPLPSATPDDEEKKRIEEARLERLREIARENLKKK